MKFFMKLFLVFDLLEHNRPPTFTATLITTTRSSCVVNVIWCRHWRWRRSVFARHLDAHTGSMRENIRMLRKISSKILLNIKTISRAAFKITMDIESRCKIRSEIRVCAWNFFIPSCPSFHFSTEKTEKKIITQKKEVRELFFLLFQKKMWREKFFSALLNGKSFKINFYVKNCWFL